MTGDPDNLAGTGAAGRAYRQRRSLARQPVRLLRASARTSFRTSFADAFDDTMTTTPDEFLTATDLCALAAIKRPRRAAWADQGLVRKAPAKQRYNEIDAAELVAFACLVQELDFEDATLVWRDVCGPLRDTVKHERQKLVLIDLQRKTGRFLEDRADVGVAVRSGHPFLMVDLTEAIRDALGTAERLRHTRTSKGARDQFQRASAAPQDRRLDVRAAAHRARRR
jgi:hypothetical protein